MRDHETGAHIERVVLFTEVIVKDLLTNPHEGYEINVQYGQDIVDAVKLHDLGKLAMPDNVLLKPGKLTEEEFRIIKTHPIYGSKMLNQAIEKMGEDSLLWTAFEIVYGHHEKWDGSGYPNGVKGDKIPLSARIAAVADVFDALTSSRPYKRAWSPREAFDLIYTDAGRHFDPYLTEIVKHHEDEFVQIVISNRDTEQLPTPELDPISELELERMPARAG
jgi:putative two-component system response regulator